MGVRWDFEFTRKIVIITITISLTIKMCLYNIKIKNIKKITEKFLKIA